MFSCILMCAIFYIIYTENVNTYVLQCDQSLLFAKTQNYNYGKSFEASMYLKILWLGHNNWLFKSAVVSRCSL